MTDTVPDPIDAVLRSDHAAITRDLAGLRSADPQHAAGLFAQLSADIVRHFVAEEQYLLPAAREYLDGGEQLTSDQFAEHERIEGLLRHLDDEEGQPVDTTVGELERALAAHIELVEGDVLPALVARLDPARLAELGEGALGAEQLAPTHPRALVFKSTTLSKVTSWLEGLIDKSTS
ncbi:MAG TPA: hemerythrin domain-containing protein [Jatrophihabitans sp.]